MKLNKAMRHNTVQKIGRKINSVLNLYRNSLPSGFQYCFIFRRFRVQTSGRRPAIMSVFVVLFSPYRKMLGKYLKLGHDRFLP
jgi:hypothetical protein